ncbi:MAG: hypothetical protein WCX88_04000 [Patescibacteria group bacterium]
MSAFEWTVVCCLVAIFFGDIVFVTGYVFSKMRQNAKEEIGVISSEKEVIKEE